MKKVSTLMIEHLSNFMFGWIKKMSLTQHFSVESGKKSLNGNAYTMTNAYNVIK
jgi:hypothetical protein